MCNISIKMAIASSQSFTTKPDIPYDGCKYSEVTTAEEGDDGTQSNEKKLVHSETMESPGCSTVGDENDRMIQPGLENGGRSLNNRGAEGEEEVCRYTLEEGEVGDTDTKEKLDIDPDPGSLRWGWGRWTPKCTQRFNTPPWLLVFLSALVFFQGMVGSGLTGSNATSIERRFQLRSQDYGFLVSTYETTHIIFTLFVAFKGGRGHKLKWVAFGSLIIGMSSFLFALPHFTTDGYENFNDEHGDLGICEFEENGELTVTDEKCRDGQKDDNLSRYIYLFGAAEVLLAMGSIPIYTLGIAILDESVTLRNNGVFLGVFYAVSTLGPAVGYVVAGLCLTIFTDIHLPEGVDLTDGDPGWVGAWWIGYVIAGVCILLISIPLGAFPRELPTTAKIRLEKECEAHANAGADITAQPSFGSRPGDLLKAIKYILVNPTYMCITLAGCSDSLMITAFGVFLPKFIENQFATTATVATTIVGTCIVPGGILGVLFGGWIIRRFRLSVVGTIKFCLLLTIITTLTLPTLFIRCPQTDLAGVLVSYEHNDSNSYLHSELDLTHTCNTACICSTARYLPVCLQEYDLEFFSPCHAGCTIDYENGTYTDCACAVLVSGGFSSSVITGKCKSGCFILPIFVALFILILVVLFMPMVPATNVTLRCVPESQRPMALGVQSMIVRCLGSIPGPILFGIIIDSTCLQWQETCSGHGSCWLYDNKSFASRLAIISCALKVMCGFLYALALFSYKPATQSQVNQKDNDRSHVS
ncbi:solute carrier organic anion transporter family member 4C1-like isoform X1 [Lytechinus pictus]|uniref:solute carrier organic anion transporter family member 4C1-like isoform X1 n=2 Tax=Lytechinus pictus TaxID=7653 RepID=UPI0030BA290C